MRGGMCHRTRLSAQFLDPRSPLAGTRHGSGALKQCGGSVRMALDVCPFEALGTSERFSAGRFL